jgi:hypothetical protein
MDAGYGDRLMLDDWPEEAEMLKPALKGEEGGLAPWRTSDDNGCTFWKDGLCELHDKGLKPLQGRLAYHGHSKEQREWIAWEIRKAWGGIEAREVLERWSQRKELQSRFIREPVV